MAWTAPRTWVDGEIPTPTMFNEQLRDNFNVLKTTRNALGRIASLSAATLADPAATNVTGLARVGSGNAFTAGRTRFLDASRLVLPVGADKYEDLGGGLRRGTWIEGDYLHHISQDQTTERRYLGEFVSTPAGAIPGSIWVEGDYLHYVDEDGDERRCQSIGASSPHTDTAAVAGSLWAETYLHWVSATGGAEKPGHGDVLHADSTVHSDSHSDAAHADSHGDAGHADSHSDNHTDAAHSDVEHQDHFDAGTLPKHEDIAHWDADHLDSHGDTHTDTAHNDHHSDSHSDSHSDHDDHGDTGHADQPTVVS